MYMHIYMYIYIYIYMQAQLHSFAVRPFESAVKLRYGLTYSDPSQSYAKYQEKLAAYFLARADPELQGTWRSLDYRAARLCLWKQPNLMLYTRARHKALS